MARPRQWEQGDGTVSIFVPDPEDLILVKGGGISWDEYRKRFIQLVANRIRKQSQDISPGKLFSSRGIPVSEGDTLLCACGVAKANEGHCHRVYAASFLALYGWDVVLDQKPLSVERAKVLLAKTWT